MRKVLGGNANPVHITGQEYPVEISSSAPSAGSAGIETATTDAFGRLRMANPITLFDSQAQYGLSPFYGNRQYRMMQP